MYDVTLRRNESQFINFLCDDNDLTSFLSFAQDWGLALEIVPIGFGGEQNAKQDT